MFRWRITILGKTPARPLGVVRAPDEETAKKRAIEFFQIEPALQFQVVAVNIGEVKPDKPDLKSLLRLARPKFEN